MLGTLYYGQIIFEFHVCPYFKSISWYKITQKFCFFFIAHLSQ